MSAHFPNGQCSFTQLGGQLSGGFPPAYLECAANVARYFPEVLLLLGAPDLEERFKPASAHITDGFNGRFLEVTLERHPGGTLGTEEAWRPHGVNPLAAVYSPATSASAPLPTAGYDGSSSSLGVALEGLDRLVMEYEALAARVTARASLPVPLRGPQSAPLMAGLSLQASCRGEAGDSAASSAGAISSTPPQQELLMRRLDSLTDGIARVTEHFRAVSESPEHSRAASPCSTVGILPQFNPPVRQTEPLQVVTPATFSNAAGSSSATPASSVRPGRTGQDEETPRGRQVRQKDSVATGGRQAGRAAACGRGKAGRHVTPPGGSPGVDVPDASNSRTNAIHRLKDTNLNISISKVEPQFDEPASPKGMLRATSWGATSSIRSPREKVGQEQPKPGSRLTERRNSIGSPWVTMDTDRIKTRIEDKLLLLFGPSRVSRDEKGLRPHNNYNSAPYDRFERQKSV